MMFDRPKLAFLAAALVAAVSIQAVSAADKAKDKERTRYRDNRIKSVTEYAVNPANKEQKKKAVQKFNADGYRIEAVEYADSGEVDKRFDYRFDPATSREVSFSEYSVNGKLRASCEFKYGSDGNLIEELHKNQRDVVTKTVIYKYDGKPGPSEQTTYNISSKVTGRNQYAYNDKGLKSEVATYDEKNAVSAKWEYKYGSDENLVESTMRDSSGRVRAKWEYRYDKKGLLTEAAGADAAGKVYSIRKFEYETVPLPSEIAAGQAAAGSTARVQTGFIGNLPVEPDSLVQMTEQCTPEEFGRMLDACKGDINHQRDGGWTPLISAAVFGNLDMVKYLIERGANPNITDKRGRNALDHARRKGNKEIVTELKKVTKQ